MPFVFDDVSATTTSVLRYGENSGLARDAFRQKIAGNSSVSTQVRAKALCIMEFYDILYRISTFSFSRISLIVAGVEEESCVVYSTMNYSTFYT